MADRSYSVVAGANNTLIAIRNDIGTAVHSCRLQDTIISVNSSGDRATVVTKDHAGNLRATILKLPQLSQVHSMHVGKVPSEKSPSTPKSTPKTNSTKDSQKTFSSPPTSLASGDPPLNLGDENSLRSLLTFRGFFSLFTILFRLGNTLSRFNPKSSGSTVGDGLTVRDWKFLCLMVVVLVLWAKCTSKDQAPSNTKPKEAQVLIPQPKQKNILPATTVAESSVGQVYEWEIPLSYPAKLVAKELELNDPERPDEKFLGDCGEGIRSKLTSLVYDSEGKTIPLDTTGMFNTTIGNGCDFLFKQDPNNPAALLIVGNIMNSMEGYVAKWSIQDGKSSRLILTDDSKLMEIERNKSWNVAKSIRKTFRADFVSPESSFPLKFKPGQIFTNEINIELFIPSDVNLITYSFEFRVPEGVKPDEEGGRTGNIRIRTWLWDESMSGKVFDQQSFPLAGEWQVMQGEFETIQQSQRKLNVEYFGVLGLLEFRNLVIKSTSAPPK